MLTLWWIASHPYPWEWPWLKPVGHKAITKQVVMKVDQELRGKGRDKWRWEQKSGGGRGMSVTRMYYTYVGHCLRTNTYIEHCLRTNIYIGHCLRTN